MRLGPFLVILWAVYLMMGLINDTLDPNLSPYGSTGYTWMDMILSPWQWSTNQFLLAITAAVGGLTLIVAASSFFTRSDIATLSPLAGGFILMGAVPIVGLYAFVTRNVGMFACTAGESCAAANIIGASTAGIVGIMYLMTVMEWWFWRPATQ